MQQKRSFLDENDQWSDQADHAVIRIDSRREQLYLAQNNFYRKEGEKWSAVEESDLNPVERGLVWQVWKTAVNGRAYLAFRGVRVVDKNIGSLFSQLNVLNNRGQVIENINQIGDQFLLAAEDAKLFTERINKVKGRIIQSDPAPDEALSGIKNAENTLKQIQQIITEEALIIAEGENGDMSRVGQINSNDDEIDALITTLEEQANICLACSTPLLLPEKTKEEKQ